jgi:putative MATE family efflux protein
MYTQTALPQAPAPAPLWRSDVRPTLSLAWPLVGGNLLLMAVYSIDVMFVSRLGEVEFAAATLGVFMFSLVNWGLTGLTGASSPIIAAELGRKAHSVREIRRTFRMALWLAIISAVPFIILLLNAESLLLFAGQVPHVAARAGAFMNILAFALIPSLASNVIRITAASLGRPRWAMAVAVLSLCSAILWNWLLVFGHAGFPALGLEGSALASVLTSVIGLLAYVAILFFDRKLKRYNLFGRFWNTEWSRMGEIARLGIPMAISWTMEGSLFGGAALLMGLIGVSSVAAHSIALNIASITFQIPMGIAQAGTIRVGIAYGAKDNDAIRRAGWTAIALGTGVQLLTAALIWLAPLLLISAYVDVHAPENAAVVALALKFLFMAALFQLFDGAQVVTAGALRGIQDTRGPMLIAIFGYWVGGFGTAIFLAFYAGWQGEGVWAGLVVGLIVVSFLLLARWRQFLMRPL